MANLTKKQESAIQQTDAIAVVLEKVLVEGNIEALSPEQRMVYYRQVCDSMGLNPLTRPFDYIKLNGKLTLYPNKTAAEQMRRVGGVSITKLEREVVDDMYIVTAHAQTRDGQTDVAQGIVAIAGLKGEAKANAMLKAESKAKRRVTLSILGMGLTSEEPVDDFGGDREPVDYLQSETWRKFAGAIERALQSDDSLDKLSELEQWVYRQIQNGKLPRMAENGIEREMKRAREIVLNAGGIPKQSPPPVPVEVEVVEVQELPLEDREAW